MLAFIDIVLGPRSRLDGLRICQHVKHHSDFAGRGPKVILVTSLSGATDRVRGSLAGCDAYLIKPVMKTELLQVLRTLDPRFAERDPEANPPHWTKKRKTKGAL